MSYENLVLWDFVLDYFSGLIHLGDFVPTSFDFDFILRDFVLWDFVHK